MRRKLLVVFFIMMLISLSFLQVSNAAKNDTYKIGNIEFNKEDLGASNTDQEKIKEVIKNIKNVDVSSLTPAKMEKFNDVIETFYQGAYQNIEDSKVQEKCYNDIYNYEEDMDEKEDKDKSVAFKMVEKIEKFPSYGSGAAGQDPALKNMNDIKDRRKKERIPNGNKIQPPSSAAAGQGGDTTSSVTEEEKEEENNDKIFKQPDSETTTSSTDSIDGIITSGEEFLKSADKDLTDKESLQNFSVVIYNVLLTVAVAVAVIIGGILGIKLMTASAEDKAEVKQFLIPYVVGCVVVFGAFGIWKLVVTILQSV